MGEVAAGPWVLVLGMHRSGTSAVSGAIAALGFQTVSADDRLSPHESNPEHWESLSILQLNDAILAHLGGTWDAPPRLSEGWAGDTGLPGQEAASEALVAAYPGPGPSVLKDPRVCLLLPYWRHVLSAPVAAVLVWRDPLAVARSLHRRDGFPLPYGVALWERYNRATIADLAETDVYVLDYDSLVEGPDVAVSGLTEWLSSMDHFREMPAWNRERATSVISANMRHGSSGSNEDDHILLEEHRRLVEYLSELGGVHRGLPAPPGEESPWTAAMLDARGAASVLEIRKLTRQWEHSEAEKEWFVTALDESRAHLADLKTTASWRITAPLRSVAALWSRQRDRRAQS
jgi:hypothetical protein